HPPSLPLSVRKKRGQDPCHRGPVPFFSEHSYPPPEGMGAVSSRVRAQPSWLQHVAGQVRVGLAFVGGMCAIGTRVALLGSVGSLAKSPGQLTATHAGRGSDRPGIRLAKGVAGSSLGRRRLYSPRPRSSQTLFLKESV